MNDEKFLIKEFNEFDNRPNLLSLEEQEQNRQDDKMILAGKIGVANKPNGNGRVYPKEVLNREMKKYNTLIEERRSLGSLDHSDQDTVSLQEASHLLIDWWWEGDDLMGKVEVLDTPNGQTLQSLVERDVKVGISSRGLGSLQEKNGKKVVQPNYEYICHDFVSEPSTAGAYMMTESEQETIQESLKKRKDRMHSRLDSILRGRS